MLLSIHLVMVDRGFYVGEEFSYPYGGEPDVVLPGVLLRTVFKQSAYDAEVLFGEIFFLDGFECLHENGEQRVFVCEVAGYAAFESDAAVSYLYDSCRAGGDVFGSHRDLGGQSEVIGCGIAGGQYLRLVSTGYGGYDLRGLGVDYAEAASDGLEVYAECYAYEDVFPAQVGKYLPDILFIVVGEGGCEEKGSVLAFQHFAFNLLIYSHICVKSLGNFAKNSE